LQPHVGLESLDVVLVDPNLFRSVEDAIFQFLDLFLQGLYGCVRCHGAELMKLEGAVPLFDICEVSLSVREIHLKIGELESQGVPL
jgi:hypothetical protein